MPKKILIVEDDESVLKLESILLSTKGYLVYGAMTGVAALNNISADHPDLIILDIMLPELDGFEVCRRIKMNPETRHIPIIFLSARNTSKDISHGKQVGSDQYITKPFKSAKLMDAIKLLLEKDELHSKRQGMLHS
ncbi:MAG: response regulator [Desulfuromusa sp.]